MNLFSKPSAKPNFEQIQKVRSWIYQVLKLDPEITISINQLKCHEPDSPPIETVIALMSDPPEQHKIYKPIAEITELDIKQLIINQ